MFSNHKLALIEIKSILKIKLTNCWSLHSFAQFLQAYYIDVINGKQSNRIKQDYRAHFTQLFPEAHRALLR